MAEDIDKVKEKVSDDWFSQTDEPTSLILYSYWDIILSLTVPCTAYTDIIKCMHPYMSRHMPHDLIFLYA